MTNEADEQRAAFEAWSRSAEGYTLDRHDDPECDEYVHWGTEWAWRSWQAALSQRPPAAQAGTTERIYVTCHQCDNCQHIGINDEHPTEAACNRGACGWHGPIPDEDLCPGCGERGTMGEACPECGGHYVLLADADVHPASEVRRERDGGDTAVEFKPDWANYEQGRKDGSAEVLDGAPSSQEWLRVNAPEQFAEWAAGNAKPSTVDWMAGWDACRAALSPPPANDGGDTAGVMGGPVGAPVPLPAGVALPDGGQQ